jgi:hypothetical protein
MSPTDTHDTSNAIHFEAIVSTIMIKNCHGLCHLSNVPIQFGDCGKVTPPNARLLHSNEFSCYAQQVLQFRWTVYSFQGGHFASIIQSWNLPFHISLVCDPYESGCSLFHEFTLCCQIFNSSTDMLNHIRASGNTSVIHGYLIQSPRFQTSDTTTKFWQLQAIIIAQLCLRRSLSIIVVIVHPDHDGHSVKSFQSTLKSSGWIIASTNVFHPDLGNTVTGSCRVITAVHSSSASMLDPLLLKRPPPVSPCPLGEFLWEPFNRPEHAISLTHDDADFGKQENPLTTSSLASTQDNATSIIINYFLHRPNSDISIHVGLEVISANWLCPAFNACPNSNIFQHHFGIEFCHEGCSYIRAILPFEFACCFGFIDQLNTASLKHLVNFVWTPPCPRTFLPGYLSKSMPTWCTFEMQILSSSCRINLLPPLLPYKHLSMVQLALSFPLRIDGSGPIRTIRR